MLLGTACGLDCPEGTVPCVMTVLEVEITVGPSGEKIVKVKKRKYKTCVPPGECPDPPAGNSAEIVDALETLGLRIIGDLSTLDPSAIRYRVGARRNAGTATAVTLDVRAWEEDEFGQIIEETQFSDGLGILEDTGTYFEFVPYTSPDFDAFVDAAANLLVTFDGRRVP